MSASLDRASPTRLRSTLDWQWRDGTDELVVPPALLNENDWIEFTVIPDGSPNVTVDARIAGVKNVRDLDAIAERRRVTIQGALGEVVAALVQTLGLVGRSVLQVSGTTKERERREPF